jgi:hypothetical protein
VMFLPYWLMQYQLRLPSGRSTTHSWNKRTHPGAKVSHSWSIVRWVCTVISHPTVTCRVLACNAAADKPPPLHTHISRRWAYIELLPERRCQSWSPSPAPTAHHVVWVPPPSPPPPCDRSSAAVPPAGPIPHPPLPFTSLLARCNTVAQEGCMRLSTDDATDCVGCGDYWAWRPGERCCLFVLAGGRQHNAPGGRARRRSMR